VISKWGIVVLGLVALVVALLLKGIINSLMFAYTIYTAGLIPIVIAGFYKEKLRVTSLGALIAVVCGGMTGLIIKIYTSGVKDADTAALLNLVPLLISIVLLFAVSWIETYFRNKKRNSDAVQK
jgi:Na+/proline symporter